MRSDCIEWTKTLGYEPAPHHRLIMQEMDDLMASTSYDVLLLFAPPGSAKSHHVSIAYPAWWMAANPGKHIIAASHNTELADKWGRRVRNLISANKDLLGVSLAGDSQAADRWALNTGGEYQTAGTRSHIAGIRADLVIIDDPFGSKQDAYSETIRERVWEWYINDLGPRLKPTAKRVVMHCLVGETPVTMGDGTIKRLDLIRPGDTVWSYDGAEGQRRQVTAARLMGEDDIFELKTGNHTVRGNARHRFLVQRGDIFQWTPLGEITKGDVVVCSGLTPWDNQRLCAVGAWLLGFMFGDGWLTKRDTVQKNGAPRRGIVTCVAKKVREEVNERVLSAFATLFGVRPKLTRYGYFRTEKQIVGRWFNEFGLSGRAKTKRLPDWLFLEPLEIREQFVLGFASADGSVQKGQTSCAASNKPLIEGLRHLARSCGFIPSNVNVHRFTAQPPNSPAPVAGEIWRFQWGQKRCAWPFTTATVRSVMPAGRAKVYDLTVSGTETFIADGLVVHNTRWHMDDLAGRIIEQATATEQPIRIVSLPAIAGAHDPLGRKPGEYLWDEPDGYNYAKYLRDRKRELQPVEWSALYQQEPIPESGDFFKREWFKYYDELPRGVRKYGASDYATKADAGDFTVHGVAAIDGDGNLYVDDIWRGQTTADVWADIMLDMAVGHEVFQWAEEGGQIIKTADPFIKRRMAERNVHFPRLQFTSASDKGARAQSVRGRMSSGKVFFRRHAVWRLAFEAELLSFPAGKFDDQVDMLSLFGRMIDKMHPPRKALPPVPKFRSTVRGAGMAG